MTSARLFAQILVKCLGWCVLLYCASVAAAAANPPEKGAQEYVAEEMSAPVVVDGAVLFRVRGTSAYPADKRAAIVAQRIVSVAADPAFTREQLRIDSAQPDFAVVMAGNTLLMVVYDVDARLEGVSPHTLAASIVIRIGEAVDAWRHDRESAVLGRNALFAAGGTLAFIGALWASRLLFRHARRITQGRLGRKVHDVNVLGLRILRAQQLWVLLGGALRLAWIAIILTAAYLYLSSVLMLFPWTRGFAGNLLTLLVNPLGTIVHGFLEALPNLAFLVVLYFLTRYALKLIRLFFENLAEGKLVLPDFDSDWAIPTYRLVKILIVAFALIVAYPYIPGSSSDAFKGVSLFIGVIFSLGSSSVISNMIAGYTMIYRRVFKVGDRVRIGEFVGDVGQVRMLVTYLHTVKNEIVAIPNSTIINGEVVNFSSLAHKGGLILHTTVGIGYETPWRQVEAMLLGAAARTAGLLREPPPFVMHKTLGDFCVVYEINAYCDDSHVMDRLYTELHRNILDLFNEYGVQIMTPAYEGDPEQPKVVPREQWYAAPARPPPVQAPE
jgi:small-conductance mechanosensitive channel